MMASLFTRRLADSLTLSLNFTTRSRNVAFSVTLSDRLRNQRHRSYHQAAPRHPQSTDRRRHFSSYGNLRQEPNRFQKPAISTTPAPAPAAAPSKPAAPPPSATSFPPSAPTTARSEAVKSPSEPIHELRTGLSDLPETLDRDGQIDWARSFHGLSAEPFSPEAQAILTAPIDIEEIEIKADGLLYLPEIKYRRILNRAFGPGAWGLAPRGETIVTAKSVTREYALVVHGRLVSVSRGEQDYFDNEGIPTATEGCKSSALRRCCKDLGIASELWDPRFIRNFFKNHVKEVWAEHAVTKKKRKLVMRKDDEVKYPFKESKAGS